MNTLSEPLEELFTNSKLLILDFSKIIDTFPIYENIELFFKDMLASGINPRTPEKRQMFNNQMLEKTKARYLVSGYGEDRVAMLTDTPAGIEGRTIHMAIDIFAKELEPVLSPCDGDIVVSNYEAGFGEYGNYLILKPIDENYYIFLGHLSDKKRSEGPIKKGEVLANLGDYIDNENGGWSRHLHLQIIKVLPAKHKTPIGYSTTKDFDKNSEMFPDPMRYFPGWQLR